MRSEFAAVAVAGAVMGGALLGASGDALAEAPQAAPLGAKHALMLNGASAGWIQSVEGGHASADVVTEKIGADHIARKHIAGVKYEDITVYCGTGMSKNFYEWIKASFDNKHVRQNGAIHSFDAQQKVTETREFTSALLTEIGFPACDAGSKDAAYLSLKFRPETVRTKPGDNKAALSAFSLGKGEQKKWLPRFRFDYAGCGEPCRLATKISAVTVKLAEPPASGQKPGPHHALPFVVTMPPPQDLAKWSADGSVRKGMLEYPDLDGATFVLTLENMKPVHVKLVGDKAKPLVELELQADSVEASAR
jgi:phage tail-like protein